MAVIAVSGSPVVGLKYTHTTASSSDWSSVANETYFYDLTDKLVHYKDATGGVSGGLPMVTTQVTSDTVTFDSPHDYNSIASPSAGNITISLTNAKLGIVQQFYRNISELNTFDFSITSSTKENVRISYDVSEFVIEGDNINNYTQKEALEYINNSIKWINPNPVFQL